MERGQTQQDFLIGIILLILTMVGVFALVPGIFHPFQDPVQANEQDKADRLAEMLIENTSVDGTGTLLYRSNVSDSWGLDNATADGAFGTLLEDAGISPGTTPLVNVTVKNGTNTLFWSEGYAATSYQLNEGAAGTTVRVVRFVDDDSCDPICRLVVRVWS